MSQSDSVPHLVTGIVAEADGVNYWGFGYPGSLVRLPNGKLMVVFTAMCVKRPAETMACFSADDGHTWSKPVTLFGGKTLSDMSTNLLESYWDPNILVVDEHRVMVFCVSQRSCADGSREDMDRTRWWRRISDDGGATFGPVEELPRHRQYIVGTIHRGLRLRDGTLAMSYSWDKLAEVGKPATGEGGMDLVCGVVTSRDHGMTWAAGGDLHAAPPRSPNALPYATGGVVEPGFVELPNGDLFMLMRTATERLWQSFSRDGGKTWETAEASPLVSHNCPAGLLRLAGDGAVLAVFNHHPQQRARLSACISKDGCRTWSEPRLIGPVGHPERPEASYPAPCELPGGEILVLFGQVDRSRPDDRFCIRSARFNRAWL